MFRRRTRVLEVKKLIYPHYGVWGCYRLVSELMVATLSLDGPGDSKEMYFTSEIFMQLTNDVFNTFCRFIV